MISEQRLRDWIADMRGPLEEAYQDMNHSVESHLGFLGGALVAIKNFEANLNAGDFNADPVPLKDIKVTTQNIVRTKDPETSWGAAIKQTSEKRQELYTKIMSGLRAMGRSTDEMLSDFLKTAWPSYKFSPSGLRTRRSELVKAGWVKADGKKTIRNGNQATAWVTTN